ncbi:histidine phosphatase family protein [Limosilactobacillus sp. RRLNB_1_1]|uniref:Histidine phosphatase family protein n=1 Tax=Limosilactobacillus albertensis TaxID=2759752 RepID=A0A7W3TTK5_9LACO|nr:histidine phosphatase family protein [Limosilactobacillus albertensis]MBC8744082.1 histidine phosphatase family protein [Lactobacillus sp. Marseille-P7033]NGC77727.1 histidine phosphatase family protein [Limosilactobacillus reuteri]MBB1070446.1 histidine phosphatase family protein [Limosilactobacillus albertensis]MCD7117500.1 histidine phosphatase family protein [Limosilactobacillus albertensis]MCD7127848.1 histidine phosphatase family protein [Limosilactobacillus albertensis]
MAITVYFVRHGETYFNRFARLQGWSDTPLTEKGKMNAQKIGKVLADLRIDYLFSSDLKRAVDTARILIAEHPTAPMKEPVQKEFFREVFYGSFEGHSNEEGAIWASYLGGKRFRRIGELVDEFGVEKAHDLLKEADPAHLAEDSKELNARVEQAIAFLQDLPDDSNVVVVAHGSIIQYIAGMYGEPGHKYENLHNGALMKLQLTAKKTTVVAYNQFEL